MVEEHFHPGTGEAFQKVYNHVGGAIFAVSVIIGVNMLFHLYNGHKLAPKHDHRMDHNHTDDAMAVQYGRANTGTPDYLSGIGGWY
jgi:hypothetical protein